MDFSTFTGEGKKFDTVPGDGYQKVPVKKITDFNQIAESEKPIAQSINIAINEAHAPEVPKPQLAEVPSPVLEIHVENPNQFVTPRAMTSYVKTLAVKSKVSKTFAWDIENAESNQEIMDFTTKEFSIGKLGAEEKQTILGFLAEVPHDPAPVRTAVEPVASMPSIEKTAEKTIEQVPVALVTPVVTKASIEIGASASAETFVTDDLTIRRRRITAHELERRNGIKMPAKGKEYTDKEQDILAKTEMHLLKSLRGEKTAVDMLFGDVSIGEHVKNIKIIPVPDFNGKKLEIVQDETNALKVKLDGTEIAEGKVGKGVDLYPQFKRGIFGGATFEEQALSSVSQLLGTLQTA